MTGLGAAIAFASAVANALALVLQSMEAHEAPPQPGVSLGLLLLLARRPRWLLGTVLVMCAWPLQILALSFAPITVVQPIFASFQLVVLALARLWLRERVSWREYLGAGAIAAGVTLLILAAPHRSVLHPPAWRLVPPLVLLGGATLTLSAMARSRHGGLGPGTRCGLCLTLSAGLGYAWADLVDKLVSDALSGGDLLVAGAWLLTVVSMGALAFASEQTALQHRPASAVGPLIGALQEPLPVVLALWGGLEVWQGGGLRMVVLVAGLLLVGVGATLIARSPAVATVTEAPAGSVSA
ncbi:MAG TPA: EamA family transporter [Solirubrobacteraceae bacterium]|nr:EamA family transporter [Solirubrobacteraceae bacterium]